MKCIWPTGEANELANSARFIPIEARKRKKIQSDRKFLLFIIKFQWQRIFLLMLLLDPHLFIIITNEFSRSFVSAIFQLNFAFGLNVCFFYFSGLRIKWKQTRCGGVTRDEWNVVSMTRGWNVKESRAVCLKVGLLNEETAKMNKVRP